MGVVTSFLLANWRLVLLAAGVAVAFFVISELRDRVDAAERRAEIAETEAATEKQNADQLAERLAQSQDLLAREIAAREEADAARRAAEAEIETRAETRREVIIREREADATLDSCLALQLSDDLLRQLPE
jgi:C4-dicarboxylate-specific signal transduction histidine kinase